MGVEHEIYLYQYTFYPYNKFSIIPACGVILIYNSTTSTTIFSYKY